eukprot:10180002-Ditylum_brightwellii.AAC.1
MTDISGVTLEKKEDEVKDSSLLPTTKEGEKALTGQNNVTNSSNKKAKRQTRTRQLPTCLCMTMTAEQMRAVMMKKMTMLNSLVAQQLTPSKDNPKRKT